ncbi:hypothetical protein C3L33_05455, partial [Rhododendron williamsianum]
MEGGHSGDSPVQLLAGQISTLSVGCDEGSSGAEQKQEKDPRKIARKYQMDLCKKALGENVIVYLETGCGKTHIAVLLMYEMRNLIKKPQKNICVFLAPTVALVEQQAKVIEDSTDFKVGMYCGSSKRLKRHHEWEKEMEKYEVFYKNTVAKLPRVFGMTASPKFGKGNAVCIESHVSFTYFVALRLSYYYFRCFHRSLEILLHAKVYSVEDKEELEQFACRIQRGDGSERHELMEAELNGGDDVLRKRYLNEAASVFACDGIKDGIEADLSSMEVLKEPLFSRKLLLLIEILSKFRILEAILLLMLIFSRTLLYSLVLGVHSGLKSMSRKNMNIILEKFRSGELNLLVATKVGEEGLDIQTCCLVIRFDLPETVASFIQSRGRARMPVSEYAFLVDRGNEREMNLIQSFQKDEDKMNVEIASRTSDAPSVDLEERTYKVASTGATISSGYSISLLHHYCSKLPHDEYYNPKPEFSSFDDFPQPSTESAKKDACLEACKALHELGSLTDFLLPDQDDGNEEFEDDSDSDSFDGEASRGELHEMLVPAALKEPWTELENFVCLQYYFVKFSPHPADRLYKTFGLFVKAALPSEAEEMVLDLFLARGRSVKVELVKSGVMKFDNDEIVQAQNFQEMSLKAILDRSQLIPEFVSLASNGFSDSSSSTFYLLLPVIRHENENTMAVDWKLVKRCLSSPIFRSRGEAKVNAIPCLNYHLELANGPHSINDVKNSLVYAP